MASRRHQFTDITGPETSLCEVGRLNLQLSILLGQTDPLLSQPQISVGCLNVSNKAQTMLYEILGKTLGIKPGCGDAVRALPEHINGQIQFCFEQFRPHREKQGKYRIGQQACLDQVGTGKAQRRQISLELDIVPKGKSHRLVL